jgi:hypothetical protein
MTTDAGKSAGRSAHSSADLVALRATIARELAAAKLDYPDHHDALDKIGSTLDAIPADAVPDFRSLDASTRGAITALIREDMQSIAAEGISPSDAGAYIAELVDLVDPIRRREV